MLLFSPADILFSKLTFSKISFTNTIIVSKGLDPTKALGDDKLLVCWKMWFVMRLETVRLQVEILNCRKKVCFLPLTN